MFQEMLRENLTRDTSWFDKLKSCQLMREGLEEKAKSGVGIPDTSKRHDTVYQGIGARQIADALAEHNLPHARPLLRRETCNTGQARGIKLKVQRRRGH